MLRVLLKRPERCRPAELRISEVRIAGVERDPALGASATARKPRDFDVDGMKRAFQRSAGELEIGVSALGPASHFEAERAFNSLEEVVNDRYLEDVRQGGRLLGQWEKVSAVLERALK